MYVPKRCISAAKRGIVDDREIEKTNLGYGLSKILGAKLIDLCNKQYKTDFKCIIPATSYGPNDCFNEEKIVCYSALMMKLHKAKINHIDEVEI